MSYQPEKLVDLAIALLRQQPRLTAGEASERLCVHRHTLQRALKANGQSFALIKQALVLERFYRHLAGDQPGPLKLVWTELGFSSASTFARYIRSRSSFYSPSEVNLSLGTVAAFVAVNLLLVSAGLFALRQNMNLRAEPASVVALLTLANGTAVPPLDGKDWTGAQQVIDYGHDPRLQALASRRLRIVYIDDNGDGFAPPRHGIAESILLVEPIAAGMYNPRAVPQLLLVDQHGRVEWSHLGKMAPS